MINFWVHNDSMHSHMLPHRPVKATVRVGKSQAPGSVILRWTHP
jgi:hypothetical protein